jgi:hypothetical protein
VMGRRDLAVALTPGFACRDEQHRVQ